MKRELCGNYDAEKTAVVMTKMAGGGHEQISMRQMRAAARRAGLISGDYLRPVDRGDIQIEVYDRHGLAALIN